MTKEITAQQENSETQRWQMFYAAHVGTHIKIYSELPDHNLTYLNELCFAMQTDGSKVWHQLYGYPVVGVSIFYGFLGNPDIFGKNIAISPNITFRTRILKKWVFQPAFGMGFSYFNLPNDPVTNPDNLLVGSDITNSSYASLYWIRNIHANWTAKLGISYFHYSNGHYQLPNIGLNLPSASIAFVYHPTTEQIAFLPARETGRDKKLKFNIQFGFGAQEFGTSTGPISKKRYPVYVTSLYISKMYGKISNVHFGISGIHYVKFYEYYLDNDQFVGEEFKKSSVVTLFLAHEFLAGHIGFVTQGGINVFAPQHGLSYQLSDRWMTLSSFLDSYISTKIGFNFYTLNTDKKLSNNLSLGLFLKANFGQADFVESTIGYRF
ncbi:MAG: acyloxyacyl hydrolase [Bacteroidales bacterium]|nr:acyloxyacyl hydrolase [Bacteroidales bacterium]